MTETEASLVRQARMAMIVIIVTIVAWVGLSWVGGALGLPDRFAILADLIALAAMAWALIVLIAVWRKRQDERT